MNIKTDNPYIKSTDTSIVLAKPIVLSVIGGFTEETAKKFYEDVDKVMEHGQDVVPIRIDSYGGQVYSLMGIVDCMQMMRESGKKIVTVCMGKAMSCGAIMFMMGDERYMGSNADVLIHRVSTGMLGNADDMKADAEVTQRLEDRIFEMASVNIGKKKGWIADEVKKRRDVDWTLSAKECKKHNIATHIGIPKMQLKIDAQFSVGL